MRGLGCTQPKYYIPLKQQAAKIAAQATPLADWSADADIQAIVKRLGYESDNTGYLPLRSKHGALTVLVDKQSGVILETLAISPD